MRKKNLNTDTPQLQFDAIPPSSPILILTNRMNVMQVLSSGLVRSREAYEKYYDDPLMWISARIPLWIDNIPANIEKHFSEDQFFSVIIELKHSVFNLENVPAITKDNNLVQSSSGKCEDNIRLLLPSGVLPLSSVNALHFMNHEDLSDFKARGFDNIDLESLATKVTPELFAGSDLDIDALTSVLQSVNSPSGSSEDSRFRCLDALAGMITMLALNMPDSLGWISALEMLLDTKSRKTNVVLAPIPSWISGVADSIFNVSSREIKKDFVGNLLDMMVWKLCVMNFKDGLAPDRFADDLISELLKTADEKDRDALEGFHKRLKQIMENQATSVSFSDDEDPRKVAQRAVTLFIMRPDPDRIMKTVDSSLAPGKQVLALASIFAGIFSGYARLSNTFKRGTSVSASLSSVMTVYYSRTAESDISLTPQFLPSVRIENFDDKNNYQRSTILKLGADNYSTVCQQPTNSMMQFIYHAFEIFKKKQFAYSFEDKSFQLKVDREGCKPHIINIFQGRHIISEGSQRKLHLITFRIYIPLPKGRKNQALLYETLLNRNFSTAMCRYAIDQTKGSVCLLSEQIIDTMDREELAGHINELSSEYCNFINANLPKDQ